jgi:branched-chain amino acid transport system ATP-binding protein
MTTLLNVDGLTKSFGGLAAVNGIGFSVDAGEIFGLIGPNGSGKTTTLNLIAGSLPVDSGSIRLQGMDVTRLSNAGRVHVRINRTFQLVRILPSMTVYENIRAGALFGADRLSMSEANRKTDALLDYFGIADKASLTGAQLTYIDQKRAELARAWATNPRVLLLDEWLAGLNPTELHEGIAVVRRLAADGAGIVLVEHVMSAVRALCRNVLVMNAGRQIAAGDTETVLKDPAVKDAYLGRGHDRS